MLTDDDKRWIRGELDKVEERLEQRIAERVEKVETTLPTEFHKWASPLEMRQKSHAAAIRALECRR